jgi:hypothetical protein
VRRPTGKFNFVGLLILLAVCAAGYWFVLFGSLYYDAHVEVKDKVNAAFNQFPFVSTENLQTWLIIETNRFGEHVEVNDDGLPELKPGLGLTKDEVTVEYDEVAKVLTVRVEYTKDVLLVPSKKHRQAHFLIQKVGKPAH